jgi:hypothetical protein
VIGKPERGEARMEDTEVAFSLFVSVETTAVTDGCECAEFERHESSSSLLLASSGVTQRHDAFYSCGVEKATVWIQNNRSQPRYATPQHCPYPLLTD